MTTATLEEKKNVADRPEPATTRLQPQKTEVGSVFVSNYPPFSFWREALVDEAERVLRSPANPEAPLGLYLHIPFCRKRCKFCYFKVYTDKNANSVGRYLESLAGEVELYSRLESVRDRQLEFIYFGGGTPSFISSNQLRQTVKRLKQAIPWTSAREVAFEAEPGTLTQSKVAAIREIGVSRLSLGLQNFVDQILIENGRAHCSKEIDRCRPWVREQGFELVNIDLIAGLVGETWQTWKENVARAIEFDADSVTVYQMELPFNTVYSSHILEGEKLRVADWETKRAWNEYAIEQLSGAGYELSSAYTMVKKGHPADFVYRTQVWQGCDLIGAGVASFGHMNGMHIQNLPGWGDYNQHIDQGRLPLKRAFRIDSQKQFRREFILQLKTGEIQARYFEKKFGADILEHFGPALRKLQRQGMLEFDQDSVRLTRSGLVQADQLLPEFYEAAYRGARYT
ncbi:MAG: coproporphyrinogen-III oxidase family protein [Acidobacteriota bacterium]